MTRPLWESHAAQAAFATGETFLVGIRPKGSWFATCGSVEFDGEDPGECTEAVIEGLRRHVEVAASEARRELERATNMEAALPERPVRPKRKAEG